MGAVQYESKHAYENEHQNLYGIAGRWTLRLVGAGICSDNYDNRDFGEWRIH
jgi:hypothetical protein